MWDNPFKSVDVHVWCLQSQEPHSAQLYMFIWKSKGDFWFLISHFKYPVRKFWVIKWYPPYKTLDFKLQGRVTMKNISCSGGSSMSRHYMASSFIVFGFSHSLQLIAGVPWAKHLMIRLWSWDPSAKDCSKIGKHALILY